MLKIIKKRYDFVVEQIGRGGFSKRERNIQNEYIRSFRVKLIFPG